LKTDITPNNTVRIRNKNLYHWQGDITVLEYERQFQDLFMFASVYLPTEQHMIKGLQDDFRQDLKIGLVALQFWNVKELVKETPK